MNDDDEDIQGVENEPSDLNDVCPTCGNESDTSDWEICDKCSTEHCCGCPNECEDYCCE